MGDRLFVIIPAYNEEDNIVNVYKSIKLLKGKLDMYLGDFGFHNDSFDKRSKALSMKEIIDVLDFSKIKIFYSIKKLLRE